VSSIDTFLAAGFFLLQTLKWPIAKPGGKRRATFNHLPRSAQQRLLRHTVAEHLKAEIWALRPRGLLAMGKAALGACRLLTVTLVLVRAVDGALLDLAAFGGVATPEPGRILGRAGACQTRLRQSDDSEQRTRPLGLRGRRLRAAPPTCMVLRTSAARSPLAGTARRNRPLTPSAIEMEAGGGPRGLLAGLPAWISSAGVAAGRERAWGSPPASPASVKAWHPGRRTETHSRSGTRYSCCGCLACCCCGSSHAG
jgi:hypothetical protein